MKTFTKKIKKSNLNLLFLSDENEDASKNWMLFDIETTGFSPTTTVCYMIGCLYKKDDHIILKQWFAEDKSEEVLIIKEFLKLLSKKNCLIHYNGEGFDIPYIKNKCQHYGLDYDFNSITSIDLYKTASKLKNILKLTNLKQKTLEQFFDIKRQDFYSGYDLITLYNNYLLESDEELYEYMMLHNREDLLGMLSISNIYSYLSLFDNNYEIVNIKVENYKDIEFFNKKEVIIELSLNLTVPKRISYGYGPYYITVCNNTAKIRVKLHTDELKFFYPNYKDYYYLPNEDTSIHKSVAFYVDKDYRTRAKAANCYSKKTGQFLPQEKEVIKPYFKIDYHDKTTYFELLPMFIEEPFLIGDYIAHVLDVLIQKKPIN